MSELHPSQLQMEVKCCEVVELIKGALCAYPESPSKTSADSEMVALKATIDLLPEEMRKHVLSRVQIVKARGKPAIISLVKYLRALSIEPFVIHDRDQGTPGAEVFNPHILAAVGTPERVAMLEESIEHALGYQPSSADKPFKVYQAASGWADFGAVPAVWKGVFLRAMELDAADLAAVPAGEA